MDILIFGGQSNMQGQTNVFPAPNHPVPGAMEYRHLTGTYIPLCHPVGENIEDHILAAHEGNGSLMPDFVDVYRKYRHTEIGAVHAAKGATTIAQWEKGTPRYNTALAKIRGAIAAAPEPVEHIYYIWLQGESDAILSNTEENYYRALVEYKNALKKDCGIEKFGIIRVGYFNYGTPEKDEAIMAAQDRACREDGDFLMLTRLASVLSRDIRYLNPYASGHYSNEGLAVLAAEAARTLAMHAMGLSDNI